MALRLGADGASLDSGGETGAARSGRPAAPGNPGPGPSVGVVMVRRPNLESDDLPIKFGPCSNGEFDPVPWSPVVAEAVRRARAACDENARRVGVSRRTFLTSLCGVATTLLALNACSDESTRATEAPQARRSLRHPVDRDDRSRGGPRGPGR